MGSTPVRSIKTFPVVGRLTITIDEIVSNAHMRVLASAFQILVRRGLTERVLEECKAQLFELSYDKIWNQLSPYRRRLMNKGIVDGTQRGRMSFTLPSFDEYVLERYGEDEVLT